MSCSVLGHLPRMQWPCLPQTTLERAALQGKLDGMTVEAIAEQLGRGRGYVYQAITSAIKQINL